MDERLVAVEETVAAGEQIALEPALAQVLGEHLHHPPLGREALVGRQPLRFPDPVRRLEHGAEPVRGGLVGAEEAEGLAGCATITSRRKPPSTRVASLVSRPGSFTSTA